MSRILVILISLVTALQCMTQIPTNCFEIESLLVDACALGQNCGSPADDACDCEGKNEMFRFKVGPNDLDTDDMEVDWPNGFNDWLGVCQNATTAQHVADLNATIQNCGWLLEPVNNVLPAGSDVLMVTSTDMCIVSNSFAGLADTLIIIFQCPGNYFGHFANQNNGSNNLRTIEVNFGPGCDDEVTYDRSLLIDQSGLNTPQDGATVNFTWDGQDSYINNGCNAPVEQDLFDAGDNVTLCPGEVLNLEGIAADSYTNIQWTGGSGTFADPNALSTTYTPSSDDPDEFYITLTAEGCNGVVGDELQVISLANTLTGITTDGPTAICDGESVTLTAQGSATIFSWSTGVSAPSIVVTEPDTYTVTVNNACGEFSESIDITLSDSPEVAILNPDLIELCDGEAVELNATGSGGDIEWSTLETGSAITVSDEGWYYASVTNDCATVLDSTLLEVIPEPEVEIAPAGPITLCQDEEIELSAVGEGIFSWSTGQSGETITTSTAGEVTVTASNDCGTAQDQVQITIGGAAPQAEITADDTQICPGETILLSASGGDTYQWNDSPGTDTYLVDSPGSYTLTASNDCGEDEDVIIITADEAPEAILENDAFAICNGEEVVVQVSGTGTFTWSDGAVANSYVYQNTGNYYIVAEAACGTDTAFFTVVAQDINAQAYAEPLLGEAPLTVDFSNETFGAYEVEWVFEQGAVSNLEQTSYTFIDRADYEVVLTAISELGCESRTTLTIQVGACPFSLYVPNAFTPDGDGFNDQLLVEGNCFAAFEWAIYDRWGRQLFYTTDPAARWTGADVSGYAVLNGDYPYWIIVLDSNGVTHRVEGSVTVIR